MIIAIVLYGLTCNLVRLHALNESALGSCSVHEERSHLAVHPKRSPKRLGLYVLFSPT